MLLSKRFLCLMPEKKHTMKKIIFLAVTMAAFAFVNAQTPSPVDSLKEYTGKYKFPEGNPVTEITVVVENGVLTATSAIGSSELKRSQGDVFELVAYSGIATFKRNGDGKLVKLRIQVNELDMEGDKTDGIFLGNTLSRLRK